MGQHIELLNSGMNGQMKVLVSCRRTYTQTLLPQAPDLQAVAAPARFEAASQKGKAVAENKLVRTDR